MHPNYEVKVVDDAEHDLEEIDSYIFSSSPKNAGMVSDAIIAMIDSLDTFPHRFATCEKNRDTDKVVHSVTVASFILYYRIVELKSLVEVLAVRRGTRDRPPRFFR